MIPVAIITMAFLIGGMMGFFFAAVPAMGKENALVPAKIPTPPPLRPPLARGEREGLGGELEDETEKEKELKDLKVWQMIYDDPNLKLWEREQNKKEKRRR